MKKKYSISLFCISTFQTFYFLATFNQNIFLHKHPDHSIIFHLYLVLNSKSNLNLVHSNDLTNDLSDFTDTLLI